MARTQKYTDDLLIDAVVRYADYYGGKIKATELAQWARNNITGLEEVRDYHFTRLVKTKDSKGKVKYQEKPCAEKIQELNRARSLNASVNANILLRASKPDAMFDLPLPAQKKVVIEAREICSTLMTKNNRLTRENEALKKQNKEFEILLENLEEKMKTIREQYRVMEIRVGYLMKMADEASQKEMLAQMGIEDGSFDLITYKKSIESADAEMFDIEKALKQYREEKATGFTDTIKEDILKGLDF